MSEMLTTISAALAHLLAQVPTAPSCEEQCIDQALGRVLAASCQATQDVPAYDNSAMDGYAVRCADITAPGTRVALSQTIAAGHPGTALAAGTAARIFTGAAIPNGADAVVMQENTHADNGTVTLLEQPQPGQNIRRHGHDVAQGSTVLSAGQRLRPQDLGLLASLGIGSVRVHRPLTVALVNTGDEVIAPGTPLGPGQLYDSNSFMLAGLLAGLGLRVLRLGIVADTPTATKTALRQAAAQADCVITTGGVSVGAEDHVRQAVTNLGQLSLWKLAIKPGKPFAFGSVAGTPFFGLPGNPVAVFVTFVTLVRPFLLRMQGAMSDPTPTFPVQAGFEILRPGTRQEYLRVKLSQTSQGPVAQLFPDQGSSLLSSLSWADGLALVPLGTTVAIGDSIDYLPFGGLL